MRDLMKSIIFSLLCILCLAQGVFAYELVIDAPAQVRVGAPIVVSGNTTFPVGTGFDLVLYKIQTTAPESISQKSIVVDDSKSFEATFPTIGLDPGKYKIEVRFPTDPGSKLSSGSVTMRLVDVTDRSGEIVITSPKNQVLGEALRIEGYVPRAGVVTLTMKVSGPQGAVIPPEDIRTTTVLGKEDGFFTKTVPVNEKGNYYVDFSDSKGYITTVKFTVEEPAGATVSPTIRTPELPLELRVRLWELQVQPQYLPRRRRGQHLHSLLQAASQASSSSRSRPEFGKRRVDRGRRSDQNFFSCRPAFPIVTTGTGRLDRSSPLPRMPLLLLPPPDEDLVEKENDDDQDTAEKECEGDLRRDSLGERRRWCTRGGWGRHDLDRLLSPRIRHASTGEASTTLPPCHGA